MKGVRFLSLLIGLLVISSCFFTASAQEGKETIVDKTTLKTMIDSIAVLVEKHYISEKIGKEMGNYLQERHQKGAYNNLSLDSLGEILTKDFYTISEDKHMSARYKKQSTSQPQSLLSIKLDDYGESSNYGYTDVKISKKNIGYLKVAHFTNWSHFEAAKKAADNALQMLQNTDALIIDVRNNPGGFEDIVAYFMSYFFEGASIPLQEYYCRQEDRRRSVQTTPTLPGKKMPNIPIYILTNKNTGSAGESLAYMMQQLDRAILIGETTAGAGNGSTSLRVSDQFMVQIANWETINAISKTSWEKVGVVPHIATSSEAAYDKAYELAKVTAKQHKDELIENYESLLNDVEKALKAHQTGAIDDAALLKSLQLAQAEELLNEGAINNMGYQYLYDYKNVPTATTIFKANTLLYPKSANVYDSYGDALIVKKQLESAVKSYQIAVAIATEEGNTDLSIFKENLEKAKGLLKEK